MGQKLRVLSANLWKGGADPSAFSDLVVAMDVDVVAVQECTPEQAEAICAVMPYGEMDPMGPSGVHTGMGLAFKRPGKVRRLELPFRSACRVQLNPSDWPELSRPAEVLNVHFAAPHMFHPAMGLMERPGQMREFLRQLETTKPAEAHAGIAVGDPAGGRTGKTSADSHNTAQEGQGAAGLCQRVVVGDFNATPLWPLYWRMASQFTDAAVAVARQSGRRTRRTWGPGFGTPRLLRIDHGFVTKGMRVDEFQVVPVLGSDHSAIVMDVLLD